MEIVEETKQGKSTMLTVLIWALRLVAAFILLQTLFFKFTGIGQQAGQPLQVVVGDHQVVLHVCRCQQRDRGHGRLWRRFVVQHRHSALGSRPAVGIGSGVMELFAAIFLLWPAFSWLGSLLAIAATAGAIVFHLTILGIEVQGDHGLLFALAWIVAISSAINLFIVRTNIPYLGERFA